MRTAEKSSLSQWSADLAPVVRHCTCTKPGGRHLDLAKEATQLGLYEVFSKHEGIASKHVVNLVVT